jgi:hypothetical protein
MHRLGLWGAFALGVIVASLSGPALADDKSCAEFRQNIIRMEQESVRPPGWYSLDRYLRLAYVADCIKHPTPPSTPEYWYRADGTPTGIPATGDRPADGAYMATPDIGSGCMGTTNPSMCAMLTQLTRSCASPTDPQQRYMCWMLLGDDPGPPPPPVPASADLPPLSVTLDGQTYALPTQCERALNAINNGAAHDGAKSALLQANRDAMQKYCPDLLAALERRLAGDPSGFWPALEQLMLSGFAPRGAPAVSLGSIQSDPGFQRMCREANDNMNTCAQRQDDMRSIGTDPTGTAGQAGAFNSCRILYGQVLAMCDPKNQGAFSAPRSSPRSAPPAPPSQPPKANPNAPQASSAPPSKPADSGLSPKCQKLVSDYVAAAQANDGPKALAGYNALRQAGGCNVLAQVDKPMPAAGSPSADDPRFAARGATSNSDQVIGTCDAAPDVCAARVQQLRAGVSPEAVAALWMNAINVGLELGAAMTNAAAMGARRAPTVGAPNSSMNSIGNQPVRSTYGQGAPTQVAPRQSPSDITGTTR